MAAFHGIPSFTWLPQNTAPQAVLLCIHGIGLHGKTFAALGEQLAPQGIATYALDVRGFGAWQKCQKGTACRVDLKQCLQDIAAVLSSLRQAHPGLPVYVLGESLGAAIAASVAGAGKHPVDGLILSAPARVLNQHRYRAASLFVKALGTGGTSVCISSVVNEYAPHVVAWREEDPLIRFKYNALELMEIIRFIVRTYDNLKKLPDIPVMIVQGEGDQLITAQSTVEFFSQIPSSDKELVVLGGIGHLIFQAHDVPHRTAMLVGDWIAQHVQPQVCVLPMYPGVTEIPLRRAG